MFWVHSPPHGGGPCGFNSALLPINGWYEAFGACGTCCGGNGKRRDLPEPLGWGARWHSRAMCPCSPQRKPGPRDLIDFGFDKSRYGPLFLLSTSSHTIRLSQVGEDIGFLLWFPWRQGCSGTCRQVLHAGWLCATRIPEIFRLGQVLLKLAHYVYQQLIKAFSLLISIIYYLDWALNTIPC